MPLKKYINGSWVDTSYKRYETGTDAVTTLPVEIFTDGQPVSSYTLKGNTETSGTPSPQNPVTISGVGNETANLLNISQPITSAGNRYIYNGDFAFNGDAVTFKANFYCSLAMVDNNDTEIVNRALTANTALTVNTPNGIKSLRIYTPNAITEGYVMINEGSEAIPYEPHGLYKISISSNGTPLSPMYFSQQLMLFGDTTDDYSSSGTATYKINKLVFNGTENWRKANGGYFFVENAPADYSNQTLNVVNSMWTHFVGVANRGNGSNLNNGEACFYGTQTPTVVYKETYIRYDDASTADDFKAFLAQEYANGTPVTVYYVLATPTTESVTAPSITTTGGTATIDVDTTVKPSELDLTYHGWHSHEPLKRENGAWV